MSIPLLASSSSWIVIILASVLVLLPRPAVYCANDEPACTQEVLDTSFVTQCGLERCEPVSDSGSQSHWPNSKAKVVQIVSARAGHRFKVVTHDALDTTEHFYEESHVNATLFADTNVMYQKILGFGSTLTDAACTNMDESLPDKLRDALIADYFNPDAGIGLNLIKTPIGSSKYSYTNYVLDMPDDRLIELSPYDVNYRIPIIKDALVAAGKMRYRIKLLASAATAPASYKQNHQTTGGGSLLAARINDYASYLIGFVAAYKEYGLNIWSLLLSEQPVTVGNLSRTSNDTRDYNSMSMRPSEAFELVRAIKRTSAKRPDLDKFRLLLLGDNRAYIPTWVDSLSKNKDVVDEVAGVAYVCDSNQVAPYDNLVYLTRRHPNKYLLASQGSPNSPMKLGSWQYAENYATEMVKNLEYGSVGWIDFNMALNLEGGPSINNKFKADAAIVVDAKRERYYRNPMFYAIGHLSKYVKAGSVRVKTSLYSSPHMYAAQAISFLTPDNFLVVFVANNNIGPMPIRIGYNTRTKVETMLETKSFNTFIIRL